MEENSKKEVHLGDSFEGDRSQSELNRQLEDERRNQNIVGGNGQNYREVTTTRESVNLSYSDVFK